MDVSRAAPGPAFETRTRMLEVPGHGSVSSDWCVPDTFRAGHGAAVVLAHGAGKDMHDPLLVYVQRGLARAGLVSVRFNFPYKEQGRKLPDRTPVLEATWRAVAAAVCDDPRLSPARLVVGGKSMGGRMASQVAAAGLACDGLLLLGYPLHTVRRPEKLRAQHLDQIRCPMLFVQGTRDRLCDLEKLRPVISGLTVPVRLHVVEGADHGFQVLKRLGKAQDQVWGEMLEAIVDWLSDTLGDGLVSS